MPHRLFPAVLCTAALLGACSTLGMGESKTSDVMQIGKDSFTVRALSPRSTSDAKRQALIAANNFCKVPANGQANRNVMLVREYSGLESETNEKFYDLTFMCLAQGDQDFNRISHTGQPRPAEPNAQPAVSPESSLTQ